jgi:hypothetical protein
MNVTGIGKSSNLDLNQAPFVLQLPTTPGSSVNGSYVIDKSNSNISQLVSLPPRRITYSGTTVIDISGNYNLTTSHLTGSLEVIIPMDIKINNLQYSDTIDNFLKDENDNPVDPQNFEFVKLTLKARNGFPLGISIKLNTYNSQTNTILGTVNAGKILEPAPVDSNGKVTGYTESSTDITLTREFLESTGKADRLIFSFTAATANTAKIYSDYNLTFNATLVVKPGINIELFKKDL